MTVFIDITTKAQQIGISNDNTNWDWINKKDLSVIQSYNANPNYPHNYRFPTRTIIQLMSSSHKLMMEFECQEVTSRPTWSTGTQAGLRTAASDLATWIAT
jgi:hypothetical protein